jgi:hypothetical protein
MLADDGVVLALRRLTAATIEDKESIAYLPGKANAIFSLSFSSFSASLTKQSTSPTAEESHWYTALSLP